MPCNASYARFIFGKFFTSTIILYALLFAQKHYSCKKWVLQWCWAWLVLVLRVLDFHPSWCELTMVRFHAVIWAWVGMVQMFGFRQVMRFVMLESAKDWILGVHTPGQHLPPCVWYGLACLLIRYIVGCESCSMVWGKTQDVIWSTRCKRGLIHEETLALLAGARFTGEP
jgi:hypothetical protein